jgi:signal transduction histidine kinase
MRNEPARAMHESSEDAQTSVTRVTGKVDAVSGWARRLTAELESVLLDTLGLAATIFHIYSEALSNVVRHARAGRVAIALTITPREVALTVRDNGIGLGEQASRSSRGGIAGMRARTQSHQGLCEFSGASNAGTIVTVNLPIGEAS